MAKFYSALPIRIKDVLHATRRHLARLSDDFHVCLEFQINKDYDLVIIHPTGIHVIEIKNHTRTVEGSPQQAKWKVKNDDGTVVHTPINFYNQAVGAADDLKQYLIPRSSQILDKAACTPFVCTTALCTWHTQFWNQVRPVPYACFTNWRPKNRIGPHSWCKLSQVAVSPAPGSPPDIVDLIEAAIKRPVFPQELSRQEIERLIENFGCVPIELSTALGDGIPSWHPVTQKNIDPASRAADMDAIRTKLNSEKILTVTGEPKIGKTTLAKLLGERMQREEITISDYDLREDNYRGPLAAPQFVQRFLQIAQIPPQATYQDDVSNFLGVLRSQQHLLILDNFESALNDSGWIADQKLSLLIEQLLHARDSLKSFVLITSISPVRTQNRETVPNYVLGGLSHEYALRFLKSEESGWAEDEAERIYQIRQGHPYALQLASREIKRYMLPGIAFDVAFDEVMPEIIDLTYKSLFESFSADERLVVQILSLHHDGFGLHAIQSIARQTGVVKNVLSILAQLSERAAVVNAGESRFRLLPQDHAYVYGRIQAPETLHKHALAYFDDEFQGHENHPYQSVEEIAAKVFFHSTRCGQIKAAFDAFMILRERPDMYDFPAALASMSSQLREHRDFPSLSSLDQGLVFQYAGRLYRHMGEIDDAEAAFNDALKWFQDAGEPVLYAATLSDLALALRKQGEYGKELDLYNQALDVLGAGNEQDAIRTRSYILGRKGQALQRKGADPKETFECHTRALELARQTDDKELLVTRLGMLGTAYREIARDFPSAIRCFNEALRVSEETRGNPNLEAALAGLAKTYEKAKNFARAHDLSLKALAHTKDNDLYGMLDRLGSLAHIYRCLGKFSESIEYYERAVSIAVKVSNRKAEAENLAGLGSVYRTQAMRLRQLDRAEMLERAHHCHARAIAIQDSMQGDPSGNTNRYSELGRTLLAMGRPAEAYPHFVVATISAREARKPHVEAWQFRRLGETLDALHLFEDAVLCYVKAFRLPNEIEDMKRVTEGAFGKLPPESQQTVMTRIKELDREIQTILDKKL